MQKKDCYNTKIKIDDLKKSIAKAKLENNKIAQDAFQIQLDALILDYNNTDCGIDIIMDRCLYINNQIETLTSDINYYTKQAISNGSLQNKVDQLKYQLSDFKKEASLLNCVSKVEESRQSVVSNIIDQYSSFDKNRIESESKKQVQKRVIIGATVLMLSLFMIIKFSKK